MMKRLAIFAVVLAWLPGQRVFAQGVGEARQSNGPTAAAVVVLHGPINDFSERMLEQSFSRARQAGARVVIVDIDTNGGLVTSALEMSRFIKRQSDVHTIAYIQNKAYSAGAMIALACDEIVMAPSAAVGDCAPIAVGPGGDLQSLGPTERQKLESPILADFSDSARKNGYSEQLALAMVSMRGVYWVQKTDEPAQRRFVDEPTYKELTGGGQWKPVKMEGIDNPVNKPDSLLTVDAEKAVKLGLAKAVIGSRDELVRVRDLRVVGVYEPGFGEKLVDALNGGIARTVLLSLFLMLLYTSLHTPGHGVPEAGAVIVLGVLVGMPLLTGYAQWWEIAAILVGIGLLALEIFVIPGFGITGITGILLVLGGLVMTFVAPEPGRFPLTIPRLPMTWQTLREGLSAVVIGLTSSLLLFWWLRRYLPKLPYVNKLILTTTVGGSESAMVGSLSNIDPAEAMPAIGAIGKALTDLRPGGSAEFTDAGGGRHVVSVVSDSGFVNRDAAVVVREVGAGRAVVRAAEKKVADGNA